MIWNDGYRAPTPTPTPTPVAQAIADDAYPWWAEDDDYDADYYPPCPICGDPCDYCPGHPRLDCGCWADLTWHDDDCLDDRAGERTGVR